jgi:hypothetical protein
MKGKTVKVKASKTGLIHFIAWCNDCKWRFEDYLQPAKGHRDAKTHVSKTGHRVDVEEGLLTIYSAEQEGNLTMREADLSKAVGPVIRITDEDTEAINLI